MSVFHVISSQAFHQIEHNGHVAYFLAKGLTAFDESHLFVNWFNLIGEAFVLLDKDISLDLSPEFGLPIIVLQVCQGNQIPKSLKIFQVRQALL
jgi:hypothetical protein